MLRLALAIQQGQAGAEEDWNRAYLSDDDDLALAITEKQRPTNAGRRSLLAEIMNRLLGLGAVRPSIVWARNEGESSFQLSGSTFGLMALQLALISSGSHRLAICDGCKEIYVRRKRLQRLGQHSYCDACSTTKASRQRKLRWRAKPENREQENQRQRERRTTAPAAFEQRRRAQGSDQPGYKQQKDEDGETKRP